MSVDDHAIIVHLASTAQIYMLMYSNTIAVKHIMY